MDVERFAALGLIGIIVTLFMRYQSQISSAISVSKKSASGTSSALRAKNEFENTLPENAFEFSSDRVASEQEVIALARIMNNKFNLVVGEKGLVAAAYIESSFNPRAERFEPHLNESSVGLMQTLISTAQWLHKDMGYRDYPLPTKQNLTNPVISMYYGAAYFHWLQRAYPGKDMEWYVRAYNGGPGHKYNSMTSNHWRKFQAAYKQLSISVRFGG